MAVISTKKTTVEAILCAVIAQRDHFTPDPCCTKYWGILRQNPSRVLKEPRGDRRAETARYLEAKPIEGTETSRQALNRIRREDLKLICYEYIYA